MRFNEVCTIAVLGSGISRYLRTGPVGKKITELDRARKCQSVLEPDLERQKI